MDPLARVIRAEGFGASFVERMVIGSAASDGLVLVAEHAGTIVGFAACVVQTRPPEEALEVIDYRTGKVSELYVAPAARRAGIGRALVERCEQHFRDSGCDASAIVVFAPNDGARAFYARLGYEAREIWQMKLLEPRGPYQTS